MAETTVQIEREKDQTTKEALSSEEKKTKVAKETAQEKPKIQKQQRRAHKGHKPKRHTRIPRAGDILYTIPLRKTLKKPFTQRANYSMSLIRSFLKTHTKAEEIKIGKHLNEFVWARGKHNFPRKVKIHVVRDGAVVKAELVGQEYMAFTAKKKEERQKGLMDKMKSRMTPKEEQKMKEEALAEGKKVESEKTTSAGSAAATTKDEKK